MVFARRIPLVVALACLSICPMCTPRPRAADEVERSNCVRVHGDPDALAELQAAHPHELIVLKGKAVYACQCDCWTELLGAKESSELGGDKENSSLGGDKEASTLGGAKEASRLGGDKEASSLGGDKEGSSLGGDKEGRQLGGDKESRELGGATEPRCARNSSCGSGCSIPGGSGLRLWLGTRLTPLRGDCLPRP
jgi:hypothetical protein